MYFQCLIRNWNMETEINYKETMKNFIHIGCLSLLVLMTAVLSSCEKDGYVKYETDYASLRFEYPAAGNDSIVYSFALHPDEEEGIVKIPFKLIGMAASQNRTVGIEIIKDKTTAQEGEDFEIVSNELPADSIVGSLQVKVKKTAKLDNGSLYIALRLCSNENFATAPINGDTYRIVMNNLLVEPTGWPFGEYSRIKHQFVIKVTGIATDYDKWSTSDRIRYTSQLNQALYEYNKEHQGNPLRDENGLPVTF